MVIQLLQHCLTLCHSYWYHSVVVLPRKLVCLVSPKNNMLENLMDVTSTVSSRKLHSVLEYLTIVTSTSFMPKASQLQRLWEMVVDPHVSHEARHRSVTYTEVVSSLPVHCSGVNLKPWANRWCDHFLFVDFKYQRECQPFSHSFWSLNFYKN